MARSFDYSKWDKIELSDDESDCHPNIDKQSWFRMKHRSRLEREEREDIEIKQFEQANKEAQGRLNIITARLNAIAAGKVDEDAELEDKDALETEAAQLRKDIAARNHKKEEYLERRKWNIDNICKVTEEKTVVSNNTTKSLKAEDFEPTGVTEAALAANSKDSLKSSSSDSTAQTELPKPPAVTKTASAPPAPAAQKSVAGPDAPQTREKFAVISYNDYVLKHEQLLEQYSEIRDLEETQNFLFKNCDVLLHEHAQSYMLLSSLEDEMNGKRERMKLVCRQSQILSHITELGHSMHRDPRDVIIPFFRRISEKEYLNGFLKAVDEFKERIQKRAIEKRKEMDLERARESQQAPLGPGGLDPYEVLDSLPNELREAFESQDLQRLQDVIAGMNPKEAKYHMKRCVDSGLWVPSDNSIFEGRSDDDDFQVESEEWERDVAEEQAVDAARVAQLAQNSGPISASDDIE